MGKSISLFDLDKSRLAVCAVIGVALAATAAQSKPAGAESEFSVHSNQASRHDLTSKSAPGLLRYTEMKYANCRDSCIKDPACLQFDFVTTKKTTTTDIIIKVENDTKSHHC